ncbi:MAG: SCO family protein [Rhodospirillales bacterium]
MTLAVVPGWAATGDTGRPPAPVDGSDEVGALRYSRDALGRELGDHAFVDHLDRPVTLADFRGNPLVISLVYTRCADVCPIVSAAIVDAVDVAREALGDDSFNIVTIGFDSKYDTPSRMRTFARVNGLDRARWHFLSADGDTIDRLAEDLGFAFFPSATGFDHIAQTTVIDQEGRVYRHVYGESFSVPLLVEPLKQLVFGRRVVLTDWSGLVDRVRLVCTVYDPASGRYRFDYSLLAMMAGGLLSLGTIGFVLARSWVRGGPVRHS